MSTGSICKFATSVSVGADFGRVLDRTIGELFDRLDAPADLLFAFVSDAVRQPDG